MSVFRLRARVCVSSSVGPTSMGRLVCDLLAVPENSWTDTLIRCRLILAPFIMVGDRSIVVAITRFRWRLDSL